MFEYHYDINRSAWIVTLDREQEIARFMTEVEADEFCYLNNNSQFTDANG